METNVRFQAQSDNPADLQLLLQQTHDEVSPVFPTDKRNCNTKVIKLVFGRVNHNLQI
jgi:hypothetical protein